MPRLGVPVRQIGLCCLLAVAVLAAKDAFAQGKPALPKAVIVLGPRDSKVTPVRCGYSATGGGSVVVTQPAPDTIVISMTGVAAAGACACGDSQATLDFILDQDFEVEFSPASAPSGQLVIEAKAYGLLRTDGKKGGGAAHLGRAFASIHCNEEIASVTIDPVAAACGEGLAVTSVRGPVTVPIVAGCYSLHQEFGIFAAQPKCLLHKKASADFAPPPTLESKWLPHPDPFREAVRTSNGFHVTVRVIPDPPAVPAPLPPAPEGE